MSARFDFEWDPRKARSNQQKHEVSFEEAATIFLDPLAVSLFDEEHSDREERWVTLGQARQGNLLVVIHTFEELGREQLRVRIISARRATSREQRLYEERR